MSENSEKNGAKSYDNGTFWSEKIKGLMADNHSKEFYLTITILCVNLFSILTMGDDLILVWIIKFILNRH